MGLFGIEHPLILSPMTGVGTVHLAPSAFWNRNIFSRGIAPTGDGGSDLALALLAW
jgi:hypothetical protein